MSKIKVNYNIIQKNQYYKIIDKKYNYIVVSGCLVDIKKCVVNNFTFLYISFDKKYYIRLDSDKFKILKNDKKENQFFQLKHTNHLIFYNKTINMQNKKRILPICCDIVVQKNKKEMDFEIKDLCNLINIKFDRQCRTINSCFGHYIMPTYILIEFFNFYSIILFMNLIHKINKNTNNLLLSTKSTLDAKNYLTNSIVLRLEISKQCNCATTKKLIDQFVLLLKNI